MDTAKIKMKKQVGRLEDENTRLKQVVDSLKYNVTQKQSIIDKLLGSRGERKEEMGHGGDNRRNGAA